MSTDGVQSESTAAQFDVAERESQRAAQDQSFLPRRQARVRFTVEELADAQNAGFDPYNSSGRFDRNQHWARVSKR